MREITGDIWDWYVRDNWITITTNGTIKKNSEGVMGRGIALQAKQRFPWLPKELGLHLLKNGNVVGLLGERMISFPVKHNWWESASLDLIERSCLQLNALLVDRQIETIYITRPGCGNGKLDWKDVRPILVRHFDDRIVVVSPS